jgi:hypothetical protein
MWGREREPAARELVVECDAFVTGLYAEYLLARCRRVPVWAWTNLLAHGTEHDLHEAVVIGGARVPLAAQLWWSARAYLAGEVLDMAAAGRPLRTLQRVVLAPLELQFAARPEVEGWRPAQFVHAVLAGLDERRSSYRRLRSDDRGTTPGHR